MAVDELGVDDGVVAELGAQAAAVARTSTSEETASVRIRKILLRAVLARVRMYTNACSSV